MSHRAALSLSILIILILAAGVVFGRDRFFTAEAESATSAVITKPPTVVNRDQSTVASDADVAAPRVIEIPLPVERNASVRSIQDDNERQSRRYEDDHEEREDD